jgi:hypothetical protein
MRHSDRIRAALVKHPLKLGSGAAVHSNTSANPTRPLELRENPDDPTVTDA